VINGNLTWEIPVPNWANDLCVVPSYGPKWREAGSVKMNHHMHDRCGDFGLKCKSDGVCKTDDLDFTDFKPHNLTDRARVQTIATSDDLSVFNPISSW
jgi:hypothetical protein